MDLYSFTCMQYTSTVPLDTVRRYTTIGILELQVICCLDDSASCLYHKDKNHHRSYTIYEP